MHFSSQSELLQVVLSDLLFANDENLDVQCYCHIK